MIASNVRWAEGGRRQRTILANPRKIQNSNKPHKLKFSWGEKIYDAIIYAAPLLKSLFFLLSTIFPGRHGTWHLKSQTQYPSRMIHVIEHLSKLQSVHLQFYDNWYFSKVQLAWEQRHLSICNSMHFRFQVNRCWFPSKEINPLLIYFTI